MRHSFALAAAVIFINTSTAGTAELDDDWAALQAFMPGIQGTANAPISGVVTGKYSAGMLMGNGDIGVVAGGDTNTIQRFYLGKGDFWGAQSSGTKAILGLGTLTVRSSATSVDPASVYSMRQDLLAAEVRSTVRLGSTIVTMKSWTADADDVFVTELSSAPGSSAVAITLDLALPANTLYPFTSGITGGVLWTTRDTNLNGSEDYKSRAAMAVRVVETPFGSTTDGSANATGTFTLNGGDRVNVITVFKTSKGIGGAASTSTLRDAAVARAQQIDAGEVASFLAGHREWWKQFWLKSYVSLGDPLMEKYYYGALYAVAAHTRPGEIAPSMWGAWLTGDNSGWGGRFFLNYNAQAPFYGVYASNHPELVLPFSDVILWESAWQRNRTHGAGYKGTTFQRTIYPFNLFRPQPATTPVASTKDWTRLPADQKSNGVFAALPLIWYWEYTRDRAYLETKLYPLLRDMDEFWRDYPVWSGTDYDVQHSAAHEAADDLNPNLDLGFARKVWKVLLDASVELGVDASLRPTWQSRIDTLSAYPTGQVNGKTVYYIAETVKYDDPNKEPRLFEPGNQPINMEGGVYPGENIAIGGNATEIQIAINSLTEMNSWGFTSGGNSNNGFPKIYPIAARVGWPAADLMAKFKQAINYHWRPSNLTVAQGGGGIETSGAVEGVNSMLLQHELGVMRVFPVWPTSTDASFKRLRAKGAFLVSSAFAGGQVTHVDITSEKGRSLTVRKPWAGARVDALDADGNVTGPHPFTTSGSNVTFATTAGGRYRLTSDAGTDPTPTPAPTPTATATLTPTPPGAFTEITPAASAVTASTHDGNVPGNVVDGSLDTRWSASGDGQWLQLDLGSIKTVAFVNVATFSGNARQGRFDIQVATTSGAWTTVLAGALSSGTSTAEETFDFADVPARWVRYFGHGNTDPTKGAWNSVSEVSLYSPTGAVTPTPTSTATPTPTSTPTPTPTLTPTPGGTPVEVTPGASGVTASSNDGNVPANAVDNNLTTRWSANGDGQWLQLDLGSTRTVTHVKIATFNGNTRQSRFDLQVATTAGVWTNALTGAITNGTTTAEETFDIADQPARWIRYLGHGNTDPTKATWNSVSEVSVFAVP